MASFKPLLAAEVARTSQSDDAKRKTLAPYNDFNLTTRFVRQTFINTTNFDFGAVGPTTLAVKNIFGYEQRTARNASMVYGAGGRILNSYTLGDIQFNAQTVNQVGNEAVVYHSKPDKTYTNELQFSGEFGQRLSWLIGGYYQRGEAAKNLDGVPNI